jgi:hypothetical protein
MGISQDDHVVVYDTAGVFSACRVYWTFKVIIIIIKKNNRDARVCKPLSHLIA